MGHGHQGGSLASVWACQLHSLLHTSQHLGVWGCGPVRKSKLSASLESWWVDSGCFLFYHAHVDAIILWYIWIALINLFFFADLIEIGIYRVFLHFKICMCVCMCMRAWEKYHTQWVVYMWTSVSPFTVCIGPREQTTWLAQDTWPALKWWNSRDAPWQDWIFFCVKYWNFFVVFENHLLRCLFDWFECLLSSLPSLSGM